MNTRQKELPGILRSSLAQYREILGLLQNLSRRLGQGMPHAVVSCQQEVQQRQEEARRTDVDLARLLESGVEVSDCELQELAAERLEVLRSVDEMYRSLAARANTHLLLLGDELARLRNGRRLVGGYQAGAFRRSHLLLGSF